jgi:hypothetical protein
MKQECSFRQWLSIYYDGEMASPWKEKMESHIAGCADCAKQLAAFKNISLSLAPAENELPDEAQQRVLQKLETSGHFSGYENRPAWGPPPIWKRRVSIPIPAAAAAVFMLIALAFLWIRSPGRLKRMGAVNMAITAETEILPDVIPFSGMESVLQYLGSTDTGDIIILKLPESRNFASYGEPSIIRAADYTRNAPKGRKQ